MHCFSLGVFQRITAVVLALIPALCPGQTQPAYTVATAAGTGEAAHSGDGGPGTSAALNFPQAVAVDGEGNVYIADCFNHRVRKLAPDGNITSVAGSTSSGYSGDGGSATSATLYDPCGVAVDSSGVVYVSDTGNHVVRKRTSGGTISRVAGIAEASYSGDGEAATSAALNTPLGLAVDASGNLYIADTKNHRIRKVATDGKISTVAGTGDAGYSGDDGEATSAKLKYPQDVAVDAAGNLYIADTENHRIRRVGAEGWITTVAGNGAAGDSGDGGVATQAALNYPRSVDVDAAGRLYIADTFNMRIRSVAPNGTMQTIAGTGDIGDGGDGGPAASAQFAFPSGVAVDAGGNVYVADDQNSRVRLLTLLVPEEGAPPSISSAAGNSAFGASAAVAPGSWIEIHGSDLASHTREWSSRDFVAGKAPTSLEGTTVTVGGVAAYLAYVSPRQVNAQLPSQLAPGLQQVIVTTAAGTSLPFEIAVTPLESGLFAPLPFKVGGRQYAGALLSDGASYALPSGTIPEVSARPARPGETVTLYGVGFGSVSPSVNAGEVARQSNSLNLPLRIFFGGMPAAISYSGLAPGAIGLYQFNVVVPAVPASDAVPLTFSLDGVSGGQTLYTAVQN